jgi:phosphatidate cytidylyltransferase
MFVKRLLSSIVLVALLLLFILCYNRYALAAAVLFLSLCAYRELMRACALSGHLKNEKPLSEHPNLFGCFTDIELLGYCGIIAYYGVMVFTADRTFLLITVFGILILFMFLYVFTFPKYHAREIMMSFFNVIYAPLMLTFIYMTRELPHGVYAVWMIFISSWICDTCAYCVGKLCGKHKLTPVLSPKKTIEGSVGGILGSAIVGGLFAHFLIRPVYPDVKYAALFFALIAAVGAVISQVGDLAASGLKRNMEIKDFGKLIPGHGGVMDRFDSVVFTAPVVFFLTLLLTKQV